MFTNFLMTRFVYLILKKLSSIWILSEIPFISEVHFGHVLGTGVAGIVCKVKSINLLDEPHCSYSALSTSFSKKCSDSVQNDSQAESENSKGRDAVNLSYLYSSRNDLAALCCQAYNGRRCLSEAAGKGTNRSSNRSQLPQGFIIPSHCQNSRKPYHKRSLSSDIFLRHGSTVWDSA
jgi:hypothetical protein